MADPDFLICYDEETAEQVLSDNFKPFSISYMHIT